MDNWTRIISAGVGPIIVISACGLLCLAFYNRLAAVVGRLRMFHREQLHEQEALARCRSHGDEMGLVRYQEMLGMLSVQIDHVSRRATLLRRTLASLLMAIATMAGCSLMVGLATLEPRLVYLAVPLFVTGLLLVILAVSFAMLELKYAMDPVNLEGLFIKELNHDLLQEPLETAGREH